MRATVTINLEPSGEGTTLTYSADAVVGGPVAGVGQRMITGVAKRMAGQFFKAIDDELTGGGRADRVRRRRPLPRAATLRWPAPAGRGRAAGLRRQGGRRRGPLAADVQSLLLGAAGGALLTLIGVLVGYRLGRRKG